MITTKFKIFCFYTGCVGLITTFFALYCRDYIWAIWFGVLSLILILAPIVKSKS